MRAKIQQMKDELDALVQQKRQIEQAIEGLLVRMQEAESQLAAEV